MLTALITRSLAERGDLKVLAIDADSAVSLRYAVGVTPERTVAEIRQRMIEDPEAKKELENKHIRTVMEEILESGNGFRLLTMGRPEGPGCFCAINDLLRYGIDTLAKRFDVTVIDCEAGPEQVNRRVVNHVDYLIIVTDTSIRGMHAASSIAEVVRGDPDMKVGQMGLIINRSRGNHTAIQEKAREEGLAVLGSVPEDEAVAEYDSLGKPIVELPETSPSITAVQEILKGLAFAWTVQPSGNLGRTMPCKDHSRE
jgi:CO dehydrogenase maturation factor